MKNINTVIAIIERLEAKRHNGTITFEEDGALLRMIELAEELVK